MGSHACALEGRWSGADPAGIVFSARFFEWVDLATEALVEALGLPWPEIFPRHRVVGVPIMESRARFIAPVRSGDEVTIHSTVVEVRAKTFRVERHVSVGPTRPRGLLSEHFGVVLGRPRAIRSDGPPWPAHRGESPAGSPGIAHN